MQYKDYYKILGVPRSADAETIKRTYRKLARKYHPDVSREKNAEERFKDVQEAYEVLRDPQKRAAFDQYGEAVAAGSPRRPPPGFEQGVTFDFGDLGGAPSGSGFSDFFDALFGADAGAFGSRRPGGGGRARRSARQARPSGEPDARIEITLEEAYAGTQRTLELADTDAAGRPQTRRIEVRIPPGARPGRRIRLPAQGRRGLAGRTDLYLEVAVAPHPRFRLDGADVHLELPVTPWEAALGAKVKVPTLGGPVSLPIPAGTQSGTTLRLRGRGLPGDPPGNQYVTLRIVNPPVETPAAREIYERMARELPFDPRAED